MEQHTSSHQWPQGVGFVNNSSMNKNKPSMEEANHNTNPNISNTNQSPSNMEKMTNKSDKLEQQQGGGGGGGAMSCPRCSSLNTKFCYYNNYSLSQPRYFCKTCRRYWTQGGSLRNVPVGGGSRRKTPINNRQQPQLPPPPSTSSMFPPIATFPNHQSSPRFALDDLNLSYPPPMVPDSGPGEGNANAGSKGLSSMMMMGSNFIQDLGFSSPPGLTTTLLDFKPAATGTAAASSSPLLNFSLARGEGNNAKFDIAGRGGFRLGLQAEEVEARVLFPKQDMPGNDDRHQQLRGAGDQVDRSGTGFWNHGLLLGGSASWIHGNHQIQ